MHERWHESTKFLCWLITTALLMGLAALLCWRGHAWASVACAGISATISAALIVGQAFVDAVLVRVVQGAQAIAGRTTDYVPSDGANTKGDAP